MAEKQVRAYWANIPAPVLYDDALSANAKLLYGEITTLMHFVGKDGYCDASNQELAEGHKWNAKSVSRLVAALADAGYIVIQLSNDPKTGATMRRIYQTLPLPPSAELRRPPSTEKSTPPPQKSGGIYNDLDNIQDKPPKAPQGGQRPKKRKTEPKATADWKPERFEGFWKFYPRGEGRQAAIRAWDKLQPDDKLIDHIAVCLKRQMMSEEWRQGIGIPHASTYLNQQRWTDEERQPVPPAPSHVVSTEGTRWL